MIKIQILILAIMPLSLFAQSSFVLSEKSLLGLSLDKSPQWESIEAGYLASLNKSQSLDDRFKPEVFGKVGYEETRERALFEFIPVWSPIKTAQIGVRQNFRGGVGLTAATGVDQRSASTPSGTFRNVTTSTVRLDLVVDLWKDIFGRLTKAESKSAQLSKEKADLEKQIQQKSFALSLRRTYWAMVANNEQIKIYESLKKISGEQLADAKKRQAAGITDSGEVAKYEAQLASREGSLLYYIYQKELLLKNIKNLLPELKDKEIVLENYNIPQVVQSVLACTLVIASKTDVPYEYTFYDEVVSMLRQAQKEEQKLASSYDGIDLKFVGSLRTTGIGSMDAGNNVSSGSYGAAFDDWQDNNRTGYAAGLELNMPFGKGKTKDTQELLAQKRFDSEINQTHTNIVTTHQQLVRVIKLLTELVEQQKISTAALEKRLSVQNRKYREARVTVNDLILDQDALLNSNLSTINTQLEIINTLFDYLAVFTETPCPFNRI